MSYEFPSQARAEQRILARQAAASLAIAACHQDGILRIDWAEHPEWNGEYSGRALAKDASAEPALIGAVLFDPETETSRPTTTEAHKNEAAACFAIGAGRAFAGCPNFYSLQWCVNFPDEENRGIGVAVIRDPAYPVYVMGAVDRRPDNSLAYNPSSALYYSRHEWRAFLEGTQEGQFDDSRPNTSEGTAPTGPTAKPTNLTPDMELLSFHHITVEEDGEMIYELNEDLAKRWNRVTHLPSLPRLILPPPPAMSSNE